MAVLCGTFWGIDKVVACSLLGGNHARVESRTSSAFYTLMALPKNEYTYLPCYLYCFNQVEVMRELVELDLRKNNISTVPPELAQCTNLVKLHLGENKVRLKPTGTWTSSFHLSYCRCNGLYLHTRLCRRFDFECWIDCFSCIGVLVAGRGPGRTSADGGATPLQEQGRFNHNTMLER